MVKRNLTVFVRYHLFLASKKRHRGNHSILRHAAPTKCPGRLEYNATCFLPGILETFHIWTLYDQRSQIRALRNVSTELRSIAPDPPTLNFVAMCNATSIETGALLVEQGDRYDFISKGHQEWLERGEYEQECISAEKFLQIMLGTFPRF